MRYIILLLPIILGCTHVTEYHTEGKPMNEDDEMFFGGGRQAEQAAQEAWATTVNLSTNDYVKSGSIQANFRKPGSYVIQFNLAPPTNPGVGETFVCEADIEWSVAGNTISRKVVVYDGVTIQGAAEGVRVVVRNLPSPGLGVPWAVDTPYTVGVSIARGSRGTSEGGPTYQERPEVYLVNGTQDFTVPDAGANSVKVIVNQASAIVAPTAAGTVDVTQMGPGGSGIFARWDPVVETGWIPLDSNTSLIRIRTTAQTYVKIVYGIDG